MVDNDKADSQSDISIKQSVQNIFEIVECFTEFGIVWILLCASNE